MTRLGLLIPSSNVVLEPLAARQKNFQVHVNRLPVYDVSLDPASQAQFELDGQVAAAKLLCDAKVDRIIWGGTSASWLGFDRDIDFAERVTFETGVPTTTTVLEINRQLSEMDARRVGMVTPYTDDVAMQINRNYQAAGFHIGGWSNHGGTLSNDFASIPESEIEAMIRNVAHEDLDAIIIMCTNVAAAYLATRLKSILGLPIIDSATASLNGNL
jgi:maleate isomerase